MLDQDIFDIKTDSDFLEVSLENFRYQYENVLVYRNFCNYLKTNVAEVDSLFKIPFLPISLFKSHKVIDGNFNAEIVFSSSGTTGNLQSQHYVAKKSLYEQSFQKAFKYFYGNVEDYTILALLPSYLERDGSSLIYMAEDLINKSNKPESGFYLNNISAIIEIIKTLEEKQEKTLLLGVSFALLDLVEAEKLDLKHTIIMETGGMKGRRKELIREELHTILKEGFSVTDINSEYGMTEMLSQAYSKGNGLFYCPPWLKVLTRDPEDALTLVEGKTGGINIIDLANKHSCSFLATQDLGKVFTDGSFEILGRFDYSDIRGCNLMVL